MDDGRAGTAPARGEEPEREQVLAAVRRATLHRLPRRGPAPLWMVLEHLAIPRRSAGARRVRRLLGELEREGLVETGREHGVAVWSATAAGRRAAAGADAVFLPESPRRRRRRDARAVAAEELTRFRARLAATIAEATAMLDATPVAPGSEEWLEVARKLAGDCRRLASAWHCLHEWPEPADDVEDPDGGRHAQLAGLRNVRLWREED